MSVQRVRDDQIKITNLPEGRLTNVSGAVSAIKENLAAVAAPTGSDNFAAGYAIGSRWIYGDIIYDCTGDSEWYQVYPALPEKLYTGGIDLPYANLATVQSALGIVPISGLTTNTLPKWNGTTFVNSLLSDDATNVTLESGRLIFTDGGTYSATGSWISSYGGGTSMSIGAVDYIINYCGSQQTVLSITGLAVGGIYASAALHAQSTSEQLRLQYSAGIDARFTVSSGGNLNIVTSGGGFTVNSVAYQPLAANLTELAALADGTDGQVLTLTAGAYDWADAAGGASELYSGGATLPYANLAAVQSALGIFTYSGLTSGRLPYYNGTTFVNSSAEAVAGGLKFITGANHGTNIDWIGVISGYLEIWGVNGLAVRSGTNCIQWSTTTGSVFTTSTVNAATITPAAPVHARSTTEQLRLEYSSGVHVRHTVNASGIYTIFPSGNITNIIGTLRLIDSGALNQGDISCNSSGQILITPNGHVTSIRDSSANPILTTGNTGVTRFMVPSGTTNALVKYNGTTLVDSRLSDDGTNVTLASGRLIFTPGGSYSSTGSWISSYGSGVSIGGPDYISLYIGAYTAAYFGSLGGFFYAANTMRANLTSTGFAINKTSTASTAWLDVRGTTEQLRLEYSSGVDVRHTVSSGGDYTIVASGGDYVFGTSGANTFSFGGTTAITGTELSYLDGATSNIQAQIDALGASMGLPYIETLRGTVSSGSDSSLDTSAALAAGTYLCRFTYVSTSAGKVGYKINAGSTVWVTTPGGFANVNNCTTSIEIAVSASDTINLRGSNNAASEMVGSCEIWGPI